MTVSLRKCREGFRARQGRGEVQTHRTNDPEALSASHWRPAGYGDNRRNRSNRSFPSESPKQARTMRNIDILACYCSFVLRLRVETAEESEHGAGGGEKLGTVLAV